MRLVVLLHQLLGQHGARLLTASEAIQLDVSRLGYGFRRLDNQHIAAGVIVSHRVAADDHWQR